MPWKRIITPTSLMGLLENATPNLNALTWAFCVMRSYIMARPQARRCMTIWRENVLWFINSASWGFEVAESMQDSCLQPRDSRHHKGVHFRTWAVRRLRFFPNQKIGRKQKWSRDGFLRMLYRFFRWYYESHFSISRSLLQGACQTYGIPRSRGNQQRHFARGYVWVFWRLSQQSWTRFWWFGGAAILELYARRGGMFQWAYPSRRDHWLN